MQELEVLTGLGSWSLIVKSLRGVQTRTSSKALLGLDYSRRACSLHLRRGSWVLAFSSQVPASLRSTQLRLGRDHTDKKQGIKWKQ